MKKESILSGLIGLILGGLIMMVLSASAVNSQNTGIMRMLGMGVKNVDVQSIGMGMGSSMNQMMESMNDKSGFDFDIAFINAMIVHHEGAIRMAQQAEHRAQHQEIKDLSRNIINTQTAEIEQMKQWRKTWMVE